MKKYFLILTYSFLSFNTCLAQDSLSISKTEKAFFNKKYFKSFLLDSRDVATEPFHFKKKDWIITGAIIGATVLTVAQDAEIRNVFLRTRHDDTDKFVNYFLNPIGNLYSYSFTFGYYAQGFIFHNERSKKVAMLTAKGLIINSAVTQLVKHVVQRERPYQNHPVDPDDSFNPFESFTRYDSFYSGHTSTAFCVATIFAREYKEKKWVPYFAYGLATSAGLARIYLDKHWSSDVLVGAVMGHYIGSVISKKNNWGINIEPFSSGREKGFTLIYSLK